MPERTDILDRTFIHKISSHCFYCPVISTNAMKYRDRAEIVAMILDVATSGVNKTKIMYTAYLSYSQMKEYLTFLQEHELINYQQGSQLYIITDKGRKFLKIYREMGELVSLKPEHSFVKTENLTPLIFSKS